MASPATLPPGLLESSTYYPRELGVNSCTTKHGNGSCDCLPHRAPPLVCDTCRAPVPHEYLTECEVYTKCDGHLFEGYAQHWRCTGCGTSRQFGMTTKRWEKRS